MRRLVNEGSANVIECVPSASQSDKIDTIHSFIERQMDATTQIDISATY